MAMALALGTDAFSVAMALGVKRCRLREIIKLSLTIGVFHILMPLLGLYGGSFLKQIIARNFVFNGDLDYIFNLIGAGLLALIGFYMIIENFWQQEEEIKQLEITGLSLIILAVSVSMDALTVGISLGMLDFPLTAVFIFGVTATVMMGSGLYLGSHIGHWLGDDAQIVGGIALIFLGIHFAGVM